MIFVDTNVFIYAVGALHPLREPSRRFFQEAAGSVRELATSTEVLRELLHVYARQDRWSTLDAALSLAASIPTIWPLTDADVLLARSLAPRHPALDARDLIHLATCRRHEVTEIRTHDAALAEAFAER